MLKNQVDQLFLLIGRITTEFSSVESLWYLTFTTLLPGVPRAATDAIFEKFKTGRQQRELILSVADAVLPKNSQLLASIKALSERTWKAADRRNAVVHSIIHVADYIIPPRIMAAGISSRSKLADKDIPAELADLFRTVTMLEFDMQELRFLAIARNEPSLDLSGSMQRLERLRLEALQLFETDPTLQAVEGRTQSPPEPSEG